ncbi:hypothetical protein MCAMS1_00031 [biofilm metagenome]
MTLEKFLEKISQGEPISFHETIVVITENYFYQPTEFSNGLGEDVLINPPGTNEGSCKIFAFAKLHRLTKEQTLSLFGDYYTNDVIQNPQGIDHQNIRRFMRYGWDGIQFNGAALTSMK